MKRWQPSRPMIITPLIPLMWTSSWLAGVSAYRLLGHPYPSPSQIEASVLIVSFIVLLANIYNLILIYQRIEEFRDTKAYSLNALLLSLVMIITVVLGWGQPTTVLIPNRLTGWVTVFLGLNFSQALLGRYFVSMTRPLFKPKRASSLLPLIAMLVTGIVVPAGLRTVRQLPLIVIGTGIIIFLTLWQCYNLKGLLQRVSAQRSVIYQLLVGFNLGASVIMFVLAIDSLLIAILDGTLPLINYCLAISLIVFGLSGTLVAAMQRYANDYRYGHAKNNPVLYLIIGMVLLVGLLLLGMWLEIEK